MNPVSYSSPIQFKSRVSTRLLMIEESQTVGTAILTRMQASSLFGDFDMFGWAETPEEEKDREVARLEASMEATRRKLRETHDRQGQTSSSG